jgi:NAD(P)-dependent dehydrogenase (short-subunit alcohol dehydrogenase family)
MSVRNLRFSYGAVVIGASGGIGSAVASALESQRRCASVLRLARSGEQRIDITDDASVAAARRLAHETLGEVDLVFLATGALEIQGRGPEKSLKEIDAEAMLRAFAVNAVGPALVLRHFAPLLPRERPSVFAVLSARVGSIGDNRLGGWYAYRSSKAALNQIARTASIELARTRPRALCVALHPGTVATQLSARFAAGRRRLSPAQSASRLLDVIESLGPDATGGFFDYEGVAVPW